MEDPMNSDNQSQNISTPPVIGRVASPAGKEATADQFYFWVDRKELVENTQIIRTESQIGGMSYIFYAVVEQVFNFSRQKNMGEAVDITDGIAKDEPPFKSDGVTFALARILRTAPEVYTPPLDQSKVYLCNEQEAGLSYGADDNNQPMAIGQIKNGGSATAGAGQIDLDYLLGANGGHMNVNGVAGRGTKSSFILFTIYMLLREAERQKREENSRSGRLRVIPIILNVKAFDLFTIDQWNINFDPQKHSVAWKTLGVDVPQPFQNVEFLAPQIPEGSIAISTPSRGIVTPYSWSLADIVERELLLYLFSDEDADDANFSALVRDIEAWITKEDTNDDGTVRRSLRAPTEITAQSGNSNSGGNSTAQPDYRRVPQTFDELNNWIKWIANNGVPQEWKSHYTGTWRKLSRRLGKLLAESKGVLRRKEMRGNPLSITARDTVGPFVIDLNGLTGTPALQRFVVATILRQIVDERTGQNAINGLVYLVALDELNRFAPRGGKDAITQLIELVAAEMRSQGIILLGAQQQASKISERVFENSGIKVIGRSGSLEMGQTIWKFLSEPTRKRAINLQASEKLIIQDTFREPMLVSVPFPAWAMRPPEADFSATINGNGSSQDNSLATEMIG